MLQKLKKWLFLWFFIMILPTTSLAQSLDYLCWHDGKAVYSSKKSKNCQHSKLNTDSSSNYFLFTAAPQVSAHVALTPEPFFPPNLTVDMKYPAYFPPAALAMMMLAAQPVQAQTTYICLVHGKPVYTTTKPNASCRAANIDGLSETETFKFAPPPKISGSVALPNEAKTQTAQTLSQPDDAISRIWHQYEYGSYDKTPILPPPPPRPKVVVAEQPTSKSAPKTTTRPSTPNFANIIYKAPTAPVLSRRQVLELEIEREQAALKSAQAHLENAKKRGNQQEISRLNNVIYDRQQNVQSLTREWQR